MFKKISFFIILSLSNFCLAQTAVQQKNVIFLWDIHDVVLKPQSKLKALWNFPHKKEALKKTKLRNKLAKYTITYPFKSVSSEKVISLGQQYDSPQFTQLAIHVNAAQKPIEDTLSVINELTQNGYTHHVGSNIGQTAFQAITDANLYPEFQNVFQNFELDKSQVVTNNNGNFVKKPSPQFFSQYLEKNNIDLKKTRVIFIDNKKINVIAAWRSGLEGIHFKNPTQLRRDLAQMGIKIKTD